jgi:hypothetical protein
MMFLLPGVLWAAPNQDDFRSCPVEPYVTDEKSCRIHQKLQLLSSPRAEVCARAPAGQSNTECWPAKL